MTTAARPTWAPAKGGNEQGGTRIFGPSQKYSSRDIASHTTLKPRKEGQDTLDELQKRNLREELDERERRHFSSKDKTYGEDRDRRKGHLLLEGVKRDADDRIVARSVDADDSDIEVKSDESDDDDDDDEEDDTEALLAELEQIKKERAEEMLQKERLKQEEELKAKEAELIRGNPLLNNATSFSVKRRWDDDVVFKNQARGEAKTPKRFINDTIRNDFHRKFLQKYMNDDDEEDDTDALLAELEQIEKERAEEMLQKERLKQEEELKAKEAELIRGNPLLNNATSFSVKRRWDDDVVFKNQARGEAKTPKRFINDTIRNDFHRKFLQKYMK